MDALKTINTFKAGLDGFIFVIIIAEELIAFFQSSYTPISDKDLSHEEIRNPF